MTTEYFVTIPFSCNCQVGLLYEIYFGVGHGCRIPISTFRRILRHRIWSEAVHGLPR